MDLAMIERYYDTVPRVAATTEEVGPFTLFLADGATTWDFYARPRLGLEDDITPDDVRRVLARQVELGKPQAIEWVDSVTPSLLPAVRAALGENASVEECPLLVLPADREPLVSSSVRCEVLDPESDDLALAVGVVHAAFGGTDDVAPGALGSRPELIRSGHLVTVAAYDTVGQLVGSGATSPRGEVSELMGIGVLPRARKQGVGGAVTAALVRAARAGGVTTAFLSAGSDDAASVYRAVGFERVGTACILEMPEHTPS